MLISGNGSVFSTRYIHTSSYMAYLWYFSSVPNNYTNTSLLIIMVTVV